MLDTFCPISNCPLVEKNGITFSVACNMEVLAADQAARKNLSSEPPKRSTSAPAPPVVEQKDCSKELGQYLLRGWKMLDEYCPVVQGVPLMEEPKTGRKFSVAVGKFVDEISAEELGLSDLTGEVPGNSQPCEQEEDDELDITPEMLAQIKARRLKDEQEDMEKEAQSRKLSELLTQGWTMLDELCPETGAVPLMQDPEGRKYSVALGRYVDDVEDSSKDGRQDEEQDSFSTIYSAPVERKAQENNWSAKLGELLLKGWVMLDEECPVTHAVPLMESPDGRKFSVATGAYVGEEPAASCTSKKTAQTAPDRQQESPVCKRKADLNTASKKDPVPAVQEDKKTQRAAVTRQHDDTDAFSRAKSAVLDMLDQCSSKMNASASTKETLELLEIMKSCGETMRSLNSA